MSRHLRGKEGGRKRRKGKRKIGKKKSGKEGTGKMKKTYYTLPARFPSEIYSHCGIFQAGGRLRYAVFRAKAHPENARRAA